MASVTGTPDRPAQAIASARSGSLRDHVAVLIVYALIVMIAGVTAYTSPTFRDFSNVVTILRQSIVLGLVAIGQMGVILTGGFDMSIGMVTKVVALTAAVLFGGSVALTLPLIVLGLAIGAAIGLVNSFVIAGLRTNPFIVTLGMYGILHGVALAITTGPVGHIPSAYLHVYDARLGPVFVNILGMALVWAAFGLLMMRTPFGRAVYAVGGSPVVARLSAINVKRTLVWTYVLSGVCGAAAGLFILARTGVGDPSIGNNLEFQSIVAVALGGTSLYGGKGSVAGTLGAVLLLTMLSNVFDMLQVSVFYQQLLLGLIVLLAVAAYKTGRLR